MSNYEKVEQFMAAVNELVDGKFMTADTTMTEILRRIAASRELTELFTAVVKGYDYARARRTYLRFPAEKGSAHGVAYLPTERSEILAFVFCLFVEFDAGSMQFGDFLLRYFYVDGSYTASYALFADRIVRPFRDIVRDAYPAACVGYSYAERPARKGEATRLREETSKRNVVFEGKIITVRCDDAVLPDGRPCKREIVEHSGGASVLCIVDGKVVLVRQFRYAYGEELYEIPAGKLERGEDPSAAAMRELEEETGLIAGSLSLLTVLYPSPGYTNEKIYIYEAKGVRKGETHPDSDEFLKVEYIPFTEACNMVARGEIRDAKTVAALLYYRAKIQ